MSKERPCCNGVPGILACIASCETRCSNHILAAISSTHLSKKRSGPLRNSDAEPRTVSKADALSTRSRESTAREVNQGGTGEPSSPAGRPAALVREPHRTNGYARGNPHSKVAEALFHARKPPERLSGAILAGPTLPTLRSGYDPLPGTEGPLKPPGRSNRW